MVSPETENQLLRSVLATYAQGANGGAAQFALMSTNEAQKAFDAYQEQQARVIDQVRAFLAGECDDTKPLENAFDELLEMHGAKSHYRSGSHDRRGPRRRR